MCYVRTPRFFSSTRNFRHHKKLVTSRPSVTQHTCALLSAPVTCQYKRRGPPRGTAFGSQQSEDMPRPNRPFKGWLRSRAFREARRLLDEEYKRYLGHSQGQSRPAEDRLPPLPSSSPPAPPADQLKVIPPPPRTPSPPQLPPSPPLRSPSPAFSDALTERIFPDTPPPPPRSYFRILESDTLESLISQFPRVTTASIPQGAYTIGPHYFDPQEIRNAITGQASTSSIPVFLPNSTHAILVPVKFFNNLFPPSSVSIVEIC
ncbi:hypothetical protein ALC56_05546 [Trachymyrmex septentrionalis]|uniref:Uncharacterized protein n=1 Tax=Trachymyrmex septentrionalis TaxID=34720 RepID=A0A151JY86_9HYME|nr:hypothetical protein ALC56_05546 [Trachymyrmex septentrionalis]